MVVITRKPTTERKKEIVRATLGLIGEKGIGSLRTSEIAERVGFSEAALFKHFSTKKEIVKATIRTAGGELIENLTQVVEDAETEDNLKKLSKVLKTHLKFIKENTGIARLLFSDEAHFNQEELRNELLNIINKYRKFVKELLRKGIEKDQVRENLDLEAAFTLYFGIIQTQILFWSLSGGKETLDGQIDYLWKHFEELVRTREEME